LAVTHVTQDSSPSSKLCHAKHVLEENINLRHSKHTVIIVSQENTLIQKRQHVIFVKKGST
jgi:hypothetical protein